MKILIPILMALFISGQAYSEDTYKDRKKFVKDMNLQLTKEVSTKYFINIEIFYLKIYWLYKLI